MNKISLLFLGFFALVVLLSCENKIGKLEPKVVVSANMCDSIKYNANIKPIIINNCAIPTCHVPGGTGNGDFTNFSGVSTKAPLFKNRINSSTNPMPPAGKIPQSKIDSIECWIDKGALNN